MFSVLSQGAPVMDLFNSFAVEALITKHCEHKGLRFNYFIMSGSAQV